MLPPGTEGDLGIRIKPYRPIGFFLGYVVMNAAPPLCPWWEYGRGSERDEGRVPGLWTSQEALTRSTSV